jgi:photosystem II stability/assembly factor-like uncharacterized protein
MSCALTTIAMLVLGACGGDSGDGSGPPAAREQDAAESYSHVHGLGVNPADEALFVATHEGLFRAAQGEDRLERVGRSRQDTMGFTVVSDNTFLGSGHPDPREGSSEPLGLIVSDDAGRSWRTLSLRGQVDLHVIRVGNRLTYGVDAISGSLLVSEDSADSWSVGQPPEPLFDLAVDPDDERHLVAAAAESLYRSRDRGARWEAIRDAPVGLLAWPRTGPRVLYVATAAGGLHRSDDAGRTWRHTGRLSGTPTAITAHRRQIHVALEDGVIEISRDGGRTWRHRAKPAA